MPGDQLNKSADSGGNAHPVADIVERIDSVAQGDRVTVGQAIEAFGRRSFLPLLMVPALLVVSPLSGVPLFSSLCGITIALISAQMLWPKQQTLWMPDSLLRQDIKSAKVRSVVARLYRMAHWLDAHARQRLCRLVRPPGSRIVEAACFVCGALMPFLEFLPFSSSLLGGAVLLMGLGLLARDGLIAAFGLCTIGIAGLILFGIFNTLTNGM